MVASSAWSLFSHAIRAEPNLEICSIHANKSVGDSRGTHDLPAGGDNSRDCAICSMASEKPLVHASDTGLFLLSALQLDVEHFSSAGLALPGDLLHYPPARPRAPPF
jgi:hypothetical protein